MGRDWARVERRGGQIVRGGRREQCSVEERHLLPLLLTFCSHSVWRVHKCNVANSCDINREFGSEKFSEMLIVNWKIHVNLNILTLQWKKELSVQRVTWSVSQIWLISDLEYLKYWLTFRILISLFQNDKTSKMYSHECISKFKLDFESQTFNVFSDFQPFIAESRILSFFFVSCPSH